MIGSGKHMGWADDAVCVWISQGLCDVNQQSQLVSQALRFLSTSIRTGYYKEIFGLRETISALVEGVVVPNVGLRGDVAPRLSGEIPDPLSSRRT